MARLSTDIIRFRIAIAAQLGANPGAILAAAGLPEDTMEGGPEFIDEAVEWRVWRAIVEQTGRDDIGLICGDRLPTQAMTLLGYVMANAPSMRIAIEKCCAYQRIIGDTMGLAIEKGERTSKIWLEQWSEWHDALRYTVDVMMAVVPSWASANAAAPIRPLRVGFLYERPADVAPYEAIFAPAPVTFGSAESYQIYDNDALDQPVIGANIEMFGYFEEKAQGLLNAYEARDTFTFKTRRRILDGLKGTTPTVDEIASALAVSVRKLQDALAQEGTSFSHLMNETRCDLAKGYLKDGQVGKAEIAYLLGYSEMSVFSRSFKKWTGLTPSEFETQNRG
ncbi:MAG: AraC family transcriptional regulator [Hyphomicrobiales bacterium]|nr:AraC family transcriptional regulator [Hyphomicrobiales bacterium]